MKAMDAGPGPSANRRHSGGHGDDLQRRHGVEGALSCVDISGLEYQVREPLAQSPGRPAALVGLRFIIVMPGSTENAMVMG